MKTQTHAKHYLYFFVIVERLSACCWKAWSILITAVQKLNANALRCYLVSIEREITHNLTQAYVFCIPQVSALSHSNICLFYFLFVTVRNQRSQILFLESTLLSWSLQHIRKPAYSLISYAIFFCQNKNIILDIDLFSSEKVFGFKSAQ